MSKLSDKTIKRNLAETRKAIRSSRFNKSGLTMRKVELSSKNFDRLMEKRGLGKEETAKLKASFDRSYIFH